MQEKLALASIGVLCLLLLAAGQDAKKKAVSNSNLRVPQIAGKELFTLKKCVECHTLTDTTDGKFTPVTSKRDDDWFAEHVKSNSAIVLRQEQSKRKQRRVFRAEIAALADYLFNSKPEEKAQIDAMPENVFQGAYLVYQKPCLKCHTIADMGKDVGPNLTHVAKKHNDKSWLIKHFQNPQQFNADSIMPKFDRLPKEQLEKMADYLLTLK
ncbi:MAG: c-type cytochrome [bacterium]